MIPVRERRNIQQGKHRIWGGIGCFSSMHTDASFLFRRQWAGRFLLVRTTWAPRRLSGGLGATSPAIGMLLAHVERGMAKGKQERK
jgi:hypothetical protein